MIEGWFDGVTEPRNPGGHAAYGILIKRNGKTLMSKGVYVGSGARISNNVAEYAGVIAVFKFLQRLPPEKGVICGDSKLVIMQLTGQWRVKGGLYLPYFKRAAELYEPLCSRIHLEWIPREENEECDQLSKKVLLDRGVEFRLQP